LGVDTQGRYLTLGIRSDIRECRGGEHHSPRNAGIRRLTSRWSGRVKDKVPSPNVGVRAAQLNR
jgi:hypothetical protein